jgi:hypothetical protein
MNEDVQWGGMLYYKITIKNPIKSVGYFCINTLLGDYWWILPHHGQSQPRPTAPLRAAATPARGGAVG